MKLTGAVSYHKVIFRDRTIKLFADLHNSTKGGCQVVNGLDIDNDYQKVGTDKSSYTLPRYMDKLFQEEMNFYFESPFVLRDPTKLVKADLEDLDYIDKLTAIYSQSLLKDKTKSSYMPKAHIHYIDIRDYYNTDFDSDGFRKAKSANPLSGSWIISELSTKDDFHHGYNLIKFILDEAVDDIVQMCFSKTFSVPVYPMLTGTVAGKWLDRLHETSKLTSMLDGRRMHRVAKQLYKLSEGDREMILEWARKRLAAQKKISYLLLAEWKEAIEKGNIEKEELAKGTLISELARAPIMMLIPLSSIIMDVYTLARMLYNKSPLDVVFAGLAHIENYLDFFLSHDGEVVKHSEGESNDQMRCLIVQD